MPNHNMSFDEGPDAKLLEEEADELLLLVLLRAAAFGARTCELRGGPAASPTGS